MRIGNKTNCCGLTNCIDFPMGRIESWHLPFVKASLFACEQDAIMRRKGLMIVTLNQFQTGAAELLADKGWEMATRFYNPNSGYYVSLWMKKLGHRNKGVFDGNGSYLNLGQVAAGRNLPRFTSEWELTRETSGEILRRTIEGRD